jgi:hypothetical protein
MMLAVMLVGGLAIGRRFESPSGGDAGGTEDAGDLRAWLWERRTMDLIVQACLVFAGALGVAAILPSNARDYGDHGSLVSDEEAQPRW